MLNINTVFQEFFQKRQINLQKVDREDGTIYKGRLSVPEEHLVEFAFWIENTEETGVAQIIFNNLAVLEGQNNRSDFLEKINELNRMYGLYYYLVLDVDNRVFARYVTHVTSQNYEILFDIFKKGTQIISEIIKELN